MEELRDRTRGSGQLLDGLESERRDVEAAIALIGLVAAPVRPAERLKDRVMGSLFENGAGPGAPHAPGPGPGPGPELESVPRTLEVRPGVSLVRGGLGWEEHSAGVRVKNFGPDSTPQARSFLLELLPGSVFPDHEHDALEEVFVLRGSFSVAGQALREGDCCRSEPGTSDWDISSEEGALLLVRLGPARPPLDSAGLGARKEVPTRAPDVS